MIRPVPLLSIAVLVAPYPALAESDFQQWLMASGKIDVAEPVVLQAESFARFSDDAGGFYELENSLLLGYKLGNRVTAWAGYVHNPTYEGGEFAVMERRAREQVTVDNFAMIGSVSLSARLRFEQRWRDGVDGTGWRARPYIKASLPLGGKRAPVLNVTTEPFFNMNTVSFQSTSGLERIRSAISLTLPISDALKLEAGYLNQHRFIRNGEDRGDHVLTAMVSFSL